MKKEKRRKNKKRMLYGGNKDERRGDGRGKEDKSSKVHSVANKSCTGAPRLPRLLRVTFLRKIGPVEVL